MKLVHWPLMGGLLHLVQRGEDCAGPQPAQAPPRCTKCNNPPINGQCTNHCNSQLLCSFNASIKWSKASLCAGQRRPFVLVSVHLLLYCQRPGHGSLFAVSTGSFTLRRQTLTTRSVSNSSAIFLDRWAVGQLSAKGSGHFFMDRFLIPLQLQVT